MNANWIIVAVVVMMGLAAANADDHIDSIEPINEEDCKAGFKDFLGKNFQMPADVAAFLASVDVDWEQLLEDDEIGEDKFKAAAEANGRPEEGCKKVKVVAEKLAGPFKCVEELEGSALYDLVFGNELVSQYWRANVACEASEPSKRLDEADD